MIRDCGVFLTSAAIFLISVHSPSSAFQSVDEPQKSLECLWHEYQKRGDEICQSSETVIEAVKLFDQWRREPRATAERTAIREELRRSVFCEKPDYGDAKKLLSIASVGMQQDQEMFALLSGIMDHLKGANLPEEEVSLLMFTMGTIGYLNLPESARFLADAALEPFWTASSEEGAVVNEQTVGRLRDAAVASLRGIDPDIAEPVLKMLKRELPPHPNLDFSDYDSVVFHTLNQVLEDARRKKMGLPPEMMIMRGFHCENLADESGVTIN